jgi:carbonic anhydrase
MFQVDCQTTTAPLDSVISHIGQIPKPGMVTEIPDLDLSPIIATINKMRFFTYQGSLTTPPCTEGVTFLVASDPLPLSVEMYNHLKTVVGYNARFIQNPIPAEENILVTAAKGLNVTA